MFKNKIKSILGTFCPSWHFSDPSLKKKYLGCSIYTYYDSNKRRQFVMLDNDFYVKYGTKEALNARHRTNLEIRYNLQFVRKIDEDN